MHTTCVHIVMHAMGARYINLLVVASLSMVWLVHWLHGRFGWGRAARHFGTSRDLANLCFYTFDDSYRLFILFLYFLGLGGRGRVQNQRISVFILLCSKNIKSIKKYKQSINNI